MDFGISRRTLTIGLVSLLLVWIFGFAVRETIVDKTKILLQSALEGHSTAQDETPSSKPYGRIKDKVAVISDTQYTKRMVPLILHFQAVLGPEWVVVFYTTEENLNQHFTNNSAVWQRAVDDGLIQTRIIPDEFDISGRHGVNLWLARPWLWEQLAPAQHVLIFQADAMICANSLRTVDDFLQWDFIGAILHPTEKLFNGGLSLRNRTMILDILAEGNNWEEETASGAWTLGGEDIWFSRKMDERGANLPNEAQALEFSCEHSYHVSRQKQPMGYHKVHKYAGNAMSEISEWCPEIALAAPGTLQDGGE